MSVFRTFFKFFPFAGRAPTPAHKVRVGCFVHEGLLLWDVPSRSGTAAGGLICPAATSAGTAAPQALAVRNPARTRVRGFNFLARGVPGYVRTLRDRNQ